eukprot:194666_1
MIDIQLSSKIESSAEIETVFLNDEKTAFLRGHWVDGNLDGPGICANEDGSRIEGNWKDGDLSGIVKEFDSDNFLTFEGEYDLSERHGKGTLMFPDGGKMISTFCHGEMNCADVAYSYPDGSTLTGIWEDGEMKCAKYFSAEGELQSPTEYSHDPSTSSQISSNPTLPDPFETRFVYVAESTIEGAREGLFAKRDILEGMVLSFYNGVRITHKESDSREWRTNDNTLSLNDEIVIDVPEAFSSTSSYCASLGHKANHSFENNAKYDLFFHPRFDEIKCIRSLRSIKKGEEILVNYGYSSDDCPEWYEKLLCGRKSKRRKISSEDII